VDAAVILPGVAAESEEVSSAPDLLTDLVLGSQQVEDFVIVTLTQRRLWHRPSHGRRAIAEGVSWEVLIDEIALDLAKFHGKHRPWN
jgi:hypothetical protein